MEKGINSFLLPLPYYIWGLSSVHFPTVAGSRGTQFPPRPKMADLHFNTPREDAHMLYTVGVILLVLWLLGLVTSYTLGGFIHIFLVIALIVLVFGLISGRRGAA